MNPLALFRWHRPDWVLLLTILALFGFGLAVLYSASGHNPDVVLKQAVRMAVGLLAMLILSQLRPIHLYNWAPWLFAISVALLLAVLLMGSVSKGANRWLDLGFFRFQPSELMKLALPLMLARSLARRPPPLAWRDLLQALAWMGLAAALIIKQPDLGTAILVVASGLYVLYLAGLRRRVIFSTLALTLAAMPVVWRFIMHDYQRDRVLTFLNPESDPLGRGWNIIQSKIAIGSGGLFGKGWGQGTQSQLEFLPERHTDFILAVVAEEFGLLGVSLLLCLYVVLIYRGMIIAMEASTPFNRLLAGSLTLTFFTYVLVNVGMVSGLLPVVGVPLPLISYGGTSMVTLLTAFGMIMAVAGDKPFLHR